MDVLARVVLAIADMLRALAEMLGSHRPHPETAKARTRVDHPTDPDWVPAPPAHWLEHARPRPGPPESVAPSRVTRFRPPMTPIAGPRGDPRRAAGPSSTGVRAHRRRDDSESAPRRPPSTPSPPSSYHPSLTWSVEPVEPAPRRNASAPGSDETGPWPELPTEARPTGGERDAIERWLRRSRLEHEQDEL